MGVFLSAGAGGLTDTIGELVTAMGTITAGLTTKPLCYFLYAGIAVVAIGLFGALKDTVK